MTEANLAWIKSLCIALAVAAALFASRPAAAVDSYVNTPPSAAAMAVDAVLIRPLSLAATVIGAGLFVVSLPFSLLGQNTGDAADALVAEPAQYTFLRPLGDFQTTPAP
ncbi:MAG: hypothetical protein L0H83_06735 [Salinisphaera sp.]|nr:hypothetical protein [Salinisphaera sp.]